MKQMLDPHLDDPRLAARYLFPRPAPLADPFVVEVPGAELHCWRSPPRQGHPTLLHFHGNGEVVADYLGDLAPAWVRLGFDVVLAEYRGYGGSSGRPTIARLLTDAEVIADAVGGRPFVYGRSVGSLPAIHLASTRDLAGLIIESGIADPLERLMLYAGDLMDGPALAAAAQRHLDHREKLALSDAPTLILHAARDHLVDFSHAERLAAWSGGRLVRLPRGDHNSVLALNWQTLLRELAAFADLR